MIEKFIKSSRQPNTFLIKPFFIKNKKDTINKKDFILDDPIKENSLIYIDYDKNFDFVQLSKIFSLIINNKERNYQIDTLSFVNSKLKEEDVIKCFIYSWYEVHGKKFNLKTSKENIKQTFLLTKMNIKQFEEDILIATQMCEIKILQDMAPNILTINKFVSYIKTLASKNKKIKLTILEKSEIKKLNMNLILGVNEGSKENAKVIIIEYLGNPSSKQKVSFVGKGIMFDSGGYNLKTPGKYMLDMKYDMSGAAIALLLVDTLAQLKVKKNISCVLPLTDNMIDALGQVPESILMSMSGKSVEVANTDAEGRLILADALTYAAKVLKSTLIIDLATLTGTIIYALGRYTGVWSTNDKYWNIFEKAAKKTNELVWRMPLDDIYLESLVENTYADTLSCSYTDKPDSNIAATWLNQFTLGVDYIHLDIAGSADINSKGQAPMFKTLIEFVKSIK